MLTHKEKADLYHTDPLATAETKQNHAFYWLNVNYMIATHSRSNDLLFPPFPWPQGIKEACPSYFLVQLRSVIVACRSVHMLQT